MRGFDPSFRRELTPLAKVIDALEQHGSTVRHSGTGYMAQCPTHDDRDPSLSVGENGEGDGLIKCMAGCETADVLAALHLTWADLFVPKPKNRQSQVVGIYDYVDPDWRPLYRVCRTDGKPRFFQQRPSGGSWLNGIEGITRVLYHLPEIVEAVAQGETIYIAEGEKDVDALRARGFRATCNPGGAGKWRGAYTDSLRGAAEVVVICDRDKAGWDHGWHVADQLEGRVDHLRVVEAATGNDVSDHFAAGLTVADLIDSRRPGDDLTDNEIQTLVSVKPKNVEWRWPGRLPKGKVVILDGDPGLGKSTFTLDIAGRLTAGIPMPDGFVPDERVGLLLCSAEDDAADTVVPRLMAARADMSRCFLLHRVHVLQEDGTVTAELPEFPTHCDRLEELIRRHNIGLVVIDPLMAYLATRTNSYTDQHVRRALLPLKEIAERTGATILVVRHLNKGEGQSAIYRGGGSIGIIAAARVALVIGDNPEVPGHRVLAVAKINNAIMPDALGYHIVEDPELCCSRIAWDGPVDIKANDLVRPQDADKEADRSDATKFLLTAIPEGEEVKAQEVLDAAKPFELTPKMLRTAFNKMGGVTRREGFGGDGAWWWSLPRTRSE